MADQHQSDNLTPHGKPFDSKKVVRNILSLGSGQILAGLIAYLGIVYLARKLGPDGFGIIGFAMALYGYFSLLINVGFHDVGAREVARQPQDAPAIAASGILIRLILAFVALTALGGVTWFLNKPVEVKLILVLTGFLFFPLAFDTSWVYKGLERNYPVGLALVLTQAVYVAMVLLIVKGPEDIVFVPLAQFLSDMVASVLLAVPIFCFREIKTYSFVTLLNLRKGLYILRSSGFLVLSHLLRMLMFTFDIVLLGFLLGEREVGLYAAPYRFCFLLLTLAAAIRVSYLPVLARASLQGTQQVAHIVGRSVELSSAISAPIIIGSLIIAAPLLNLLFGSEYLQGTSAFRLLVLSIGFIFISDISQNILLVYNRLNVYMWIVATAAGINVGLNWILIPRYGLIGAAFTTVLAEGILLLMGLLAIYRIGVLPDFRPALKPFLAAGVMGISLIALGSNQNLGFYLGVGFILYIFVLTIFQGIPRDAKPYLKDLASVVSESGKRVRKA